MSNEIRTFDQVDPQEYDAAVAEANADSAPAAYVHHFKKPFEYNGKTYDELGFRFDDLTGEDSLAIEAELQAKGIMVVAPTFNGEYLMRVAARACTEDIGTDGFKRMRIVDFERIRSRTRNFLMASES
jgi:hypothetical protein